jgi:hypothetical protein
MSNVSALPGCRAPTHEPNEALIEALKGLVSRAERGELQSLVGTGFTADGLRVAVWFDLEPNIYAMLGAIGWLEHEYVHRHTVAGAR